MFESAKDNLIPKRKNDNVKKVALCKHVEFAVQRVLFYNFYVSVNC